jgi:hypothetical protein
MATKHAIYCDICGKEIKCEEPSVFHCEFTDNNFHCEDNFGKQLVRYHFDICHECAYEFNDFNWYENMIPILQKITDAQKRMNGGKR